MQLRPERALSRCRISQRVLVFKVLSHKCVPFGTSSQPREKRQKKTKNKQIIQSDESLNLITVPVHEIYVNGHAERGPRLLISFTNINFIAGDLKHHYGKSRILFVALEFGRMVECHVLYLPEYHHERYDIIIQLVGWCRRIDVRRAEASIDNKSPN